MNRSILLVFISVLFCLGAYAQEPKNNLRKTIVQLRQDFPDLVENGISNGYKRYKSPKAEVYFNTMDGIVTEESTYIFEDGNFLQDYYNSLLNSFSKSTDERDRRRGETYDITSFYYSYFRVKISLYYNSHIAIEYCLNEHSTDLHDKIRQRRGW